MNSKTVHVVASVHTILIVIVPFVESCFCVSISIVHIVAVHVVIVVIPNVVVIVAVVVSASVLLVTVSRGSLWALSK